MKIKITIEAEVKHSYKANGLPLDLSEVSNESQFYRQLNTVAIATVMKAINEKLVGSKNDLKTIAGNVEAEIVGISYPELD